MLERDDIDIDNLPQACVDDCKKKVNIFPFGECTGGRLCEYKMKLARKWENPEPQTELVNGKEVITTKSVLICNAEGMEIQAASSGQEFGKKLAEQLNLKAEMDAKYPGLYDLLMDPYGSLYLNEGMFQNALAFLKDQIEDRGDIFLPTIFDGNDLKNEMMRLALGRLMPRCDISTYDRFINGLEDTGLLTGMNEKEGWDVHYLNKEMMEMLWKDCIETDKRIKTEPEFRWQEENRVFTGSMSDAMTQLSKAVVMYLAMQSQPTEKTGENLLDKAKEKIRNKLENGSSKNKIPKTTEERLDELVKQIRKDIGKDYPDGNVGAAVTDIKGVTSEIKAYSKYNNSISNSNLNHEYSYNFGKSNRIFDVKMVNKENIVDGSGAYSRAFDTESKMLEDIAHQLGYNKFYVDETVTGNIYMITERSPCASCESVINQFEQMFPNVKVTVKTI